MPGAGSLPFGGGPAGGVGPSGVFDVFDVLGATTSTLLAEAYTTVTGGVSHVFPDGSGAITLAGDADPFAQVFVDKPVSAQWTLEWRLHAVSLPHDFTRPDEDFLLVAGVDRTGLAAGFSFSRAGIAYTAGRGCALEPIPGSPDFVGEGVEWVYRVAVDHRSDNVYFFATLAEDVDRIGHQLRAILPGLDAARVPVTLVEGVELSTRGATSATLALVTGLRLASYFLIPNLPPVAHAGADQAVRTCTVVELDGSQSFDPEGAPLHYGWRVIDVPSGSAHLTVEALTGTTPAGASPPLAVFTDRFYSTDLVAVTPAVGAVLLVRGLAYSIIGYGSDAFGSYVRSATSDIPVGLSGEPFKLIAQTGLTDSLTSRARYYPDLPGVYRFDLVVFDGELVSAPAACVVNVLESFVPRGIIPDVGFVWNTISNVWSLVEGREAIASIWTGVALIAAGELLHTWQIDYSKSLRDIQPRLQRRWLHHSLALVEPAPEATSLRPVFRPIDSTEIPSGGATASGLKVSISFPTGTREVVFTGADPISSADLALQLRTAVAGTGITVTRIVSRVTGGAVLRLSAAFRLDLTEATTFPAFDPALYASTDSALFTGADAFPSRANSFVLSRSLLGLDVAEDDALVVAGVGYRVRRVVDDPLDEYPFSRVVVREEVAITATGAWSLPSLARSTTTDFWAGLVSAGDIARVEITPATGPTVDVDVPVVAAIEGLPTRVAVDLSAIAAPLGQGAEVLLERVLRLHYLPLAAEVVDLPRLQEKIAAPAEYEILRRNVDFRLVDFRGSNAVAFSAGVWVHDDGTGAYVADTTYPARLWAEVTYLDNGEAIEGNFGIPAGLTRADAAVIAPDLNYLAAVRGLWLAYLNGPRVFNLRVGAQILLGLPFAEVAGRVEEVQGDFSPTQGRLLLRDLASPEVVRSYHYPRGLSVETNPATGREYTVGDEVAAFAPLATGVEVFDYVDNPRWFADFLGQGVFLEVAKFFRFLVRIEASAFDLTSFGFVRDFLQRIRPTYVEPLFVVRHTAGPEEINTTASTAYAAQLAIADSVCAERRGSTFAYDDTRSGGKAFPGSPDGGTRWRNAYDSNDDPDDAAPVAPTPDTPIVWGYDKRYLCPGDVITGVVTAVWPGGIPTFDSIFVYDAPIYDAADTGFTTPIAWAFDTSLPAGTYSVPRTM